MAEEHKPDVAGFVDDVRNAVRAALEPKGLLGDFGVSATDRCVDLVAAAATARRLSPDDALASLVRVFVDEIRWQQTLAQALGNSPPLKLEVGRPSEEERQDFMLHHWEAYVDGAEEGRVPDRFLHRGEPSYQGMLDMAKAMYERFRACPATDKVAPVWWRMYDHYRVHAYKKGSARKAITAARKRREEGGK